MFHIKFKNNIVASIKSYRQTDIKRTTGIQSRVITIPGAVVDFVEKIFHPEPPIPSHPFQLKRMPGIQIPLRKTGSMIHIIGLRVAPFLDATVKVDIQMI